MNQRIIFGTIIFFVAVFTTSQGIGGWWPFGDKNQDKKINELINEYKKFEKSSNYNQEMLAKIEQVVKGEGKKNMTLRMAYMRLRYYKATYNNDQTTIQKVSNEAESLLKGDHPLFREHVRQNGVENFLIQLKKARYNEKRTTNWIAVMVTCAVCMISSIVVIRKKISKSILFTLLGLVGGLIEGALIYKYIVFEFWYSTDIVYSNIPSVPLII
jgi:hypothetical protein